MINIRQAKASEKSLLESKYLARIDELSQKGIVQWSKSDVLWKNLKKYYTIDNFYIVWIDDEFAGSFCIVDDDSLYWKDDIPKEALYIHKIIVMEKFSHQGLGNVILSFLKEQGRKVGVKAVKLDVRDYKKKLRTLYETNGFVLDHVDTFIGNEYETCLYRYDLK